MAIGNILENVGVLTGFPFGHYYFTDLMGPKLLHVPILLGLAYVGMSYLSWTLGRLILGGSRSPLAGSRVVTLPLIASFIMVAWDLSQDPVWSTVLHAWIWRQGGSYFGVPAGPAVVSDPAGAQWKVSDITGASALVSIFVMGAFALIAWVRLVTQGHALSRTPLKADY